MNEPEVFQESGDASRSYRSNSCNQLNRSRTNYGDEPPHIGNYRILKTIGKGNFAKVKLAKHVLTGREVNMLPVQWSIKKKH